MFFTKEKWIKGGVLIFFMVLTLIHLFPLSVNPADGLNETIDGLLNTWIINWVQTHLFTNPFSLFDAGIFYPHPNSLSFSEFLLPQALVSLPVYFLSKNPVLAYNFVFFLSYILAAYGMFLLVRRLTGHLLASVAAGTMFAFNTFMIHHITHLQLLSAGLIPLCFLYLHKFFEDRTWKTSFLFAFFFMLQALACVYYGLFLVSIFLVVLPAFFILFSKNLNPRFLLRFFPPLAAAGGIVLLFSLPYVSLIKAFHFERPLAEGADLVNYLGTNPQNILLSRWLTPLGTHEHFLLPGLAVLVLAGFLIIKKRKLYFHLPKGVRIIFWAIAAFSLLTVAAVRLTGGFSWKAGFLSLSAHNVAKQALIVFIPAVLYLFCSFFAFVFRKKEESRENRYFFVYLLLSVWALLLSLGKNFTFLGDSTSVMPMPFRLMYHVVPGFKGIRVPARYAVFVIFALVVLAAYGIKLLWDRIGSHRGKIIAAVGLLLFINLEYLTIPQRINRVPVKNDIPPTYTWLREQPGDFAVAELPFQKPVGHEAGYMYFSIYHGKKIVNGYSGFIPPASDYLRQIFTGFPSMAGMDILRTFGVKYIVIHPRFWTPDIAARKMQRLEEEFVEDLRPVKEFRYTVEEGGGVFDRFGQDFIYEVLPGDERIKVPPGPFREISSSEWTVQTNAHPELLPFLKDGDMETRWTTQSAKKTGDYLLVRFRQPKNPVKISLFLGSHAYEYAVDIKVEAFTATKEWKRINRFYSRGELAENLVFSPLNPVQNIYLRDMRTGLLKITHIGHDKQFWWSVAELKIYEATRSF
ncbi:MAG: hypothetical protein JXB26_09040 [Candidatus Aminicenantes bacterium]|nr:hypothetical protein [Candidatus Aminicenantes bacterium]